MVLHRRGSLVLLALASLTLVACPDDSPEPVADVDEGSAPVPEISALAEQEPNDSVDDAMRIVGDRPVRGETAGGDIDVFLIAPSATPSGIVIDAEGPGRLEVRRPQDGVSTSFTFDAGEHVLGPFERGSTLLATVRDASAYTIALQDEDEARCGFGREPDTREHPGVDVASVPALVRGCITAVDDVDVFHLSAEALAEVDGMGIEVSGVEGVSYLARIETESGTVLTELSGGPGEALRLPNLAAPAHGSARIVISSLSGANEAMAYELQLRRLPPLNGTIELEPNDEPMIATPVERIHLINGYLHRPGDKDVYRILVEEPTLARLLVDSPQDVDLQLEVPGGPLGTLIIDDAEAGEQERVCSLRLEPGDEGTVLSVFARSVGMANLEPYLIQFQLLDSEEWEVEPNDQLADVLAAIPPSASRGDGPPIGLWRTPESVSSQVSGYAFPPGDVDRFVIEVFGDPRAAVTYTSVTLRLEPNGQSDYSLEVLDEDGAAVAMANTGGVAEMESVRLDLPSGRYVARVKLEEGDACALPYRLSVLQTALPGSPESDEETEEERPDPSETIEAMRLRAAERERSLEMDIDLGIADRGRTRDEVAAERDDADEGSGDRVGEDIDRARLRRRPPSPSLPRFDPPGR